MHAREHMAFLSSPYSNEKRARGHFERLEISKSHLLEELLVSEIKYLSYLKKIVQHFAEPLRESGLLPGELHSEVFGFISPIINVNETLLESILTLGIEEAFLTLAPCLKLYADYARRYQSILVILETCSSLSYELQQFLEHQESSPNVRLQLPALLIMPIQRIPRYSLLFQELLIVYLRQDGLSDSHAYSCIEGILRVTREKTVVPEQVCKHILRMYECAQTRQPYPEDCELASDLMFLGQFLHTIRLRTARLLSAFSSISSTSTYLNELVRVNDEAAMTAFLQSRLLGCWTRNLLMVPGRRLLRYGLVDKRNVLNGCRHLRLLVLFSDILILATPRHVLRWHQLSVNSKLRRLNRTIRPGHRKMWYLRFPRRNKLSLFHSNHLRNMDHQVMKKTLRSSAGDVSTLTLGRPVDLLNDTTVRFSCVAVYPLHHCQLECHFRQFNEGHLYTICESPELASAVSSPSATVAATRLSLAGNTSGSSFWPPHGKQSLSASPDEDYAFTVYCRGSHFTLSFRSRDSAEDSFSVLTDAIRAVQFARQSLKKASSAKRPMAASDFIRYEERLRTREQVETHFEDDDIPENSFGLDSASPKQMFSSSSIRNASHQFCGLFCKRVSRRKLTSTSVPHPTYSPCTTACVPPFFFSTNHTAADLTSNVFLLTVNPRKDDIFDHNSVGTVPRSLQPPTSTSSVFSNECPSRLKPQLPSLRDADSPLALANQHLLQRNLSRRSPTSFGSRCCSM
ncbi:unnamed protein product [Dicrocoelium dendriticum]|nr:unnamed protein product [Dicrocoelium dendriticum]